MTGDTQKKLLKNKKVVEEINRHRWIQSEQVGHDVGFDSASADWLEKFSKAWMQYHMPKRKKTSSKTSKNAAIRKTPSRKKATKSRAK